MCFFVSKLFDECLDYTSFDSLSIEFQVGCFQLSTIWCISLNGRQERPLLLLYFKY